MTAVVTTKSKIFSWLIRLIGLAIFVVIVWRLDWSVVIDVRHRFTFGSILIILGAAGVHFWLKSLRWIILSDIQNIKIKMFEGFGLCMAAIYLGLITPGRVGEISKIYFLKHRTPTISWAKASANVIFDRLLDLFMLLGISTIGLWYYFSNWHFVELVVVPLIGLIIFLGYYFRHVWFNFLVNVLPVKKTLIAQIKQTSHELLSEFRLLVKSPKFILALGVHLISFAIFYSMIYYLNIKLNLGLDFAASSLIISMAMLISMIPISFAGIGSRDVVLVSLFSVHHLSTEQAIQFSGVYLFSFILFSGVVGFLAYNLSFVNKINKNL
ncbi:TPA: hypothetical protein DF272_03355 [Candidatus Falkowbacteria bacterium]|nr:hypothetical protein [Candidatus Falkowbacteria bacterium]